MGEYMNFKEVISETRERLNPVKTGKRKTNAMVKGYCSTMIVFAFVIILAWATLDTPVYKFTIIASIVSMEVLFGAYSFLSLRIRRIEEQLEEPVLKKKK